MFQEAISHVRHKDKMIRFLDLHFTNLTIYQNKTFEQIYEMVHKLVKSAYQIGKLAIYDITAAICRHYGIIITKVYIIGGGPKRAIIRLQLDTQTQKIHRLKLKYVLIEDIQNAFRELKLKHDDTIYTNNGDIIESYLCNWQKY